MRLTRRPYNRYDIKFRNNSKIHGYYKSTSLRCYTDNGTTKDLVLILPNKTFYI